jgi:hypothetical protein
MSKKFGANVGAPYRKIEPVVELSATTYVEEVLKVVEEEATFEMGEAPKTEGWKAKREKKKTDEPTQSEQ